MTSTQRTAISTPAVGLVVYQTDATEGLYQYLSTGWSAVSGGGGTNIYNSDGTLTGNRVLSLGGFYLAFGATTSGFINSPFQFQHTATNGFTATFNNTSASGAGGIIIGSQSSRYMHIGMSGASYTFPVASAAFIHNPYSDLYITGGSSSQPTTSDVIMSLFRSTKNVVIGGTTDAGYKLDVQGTGRFTGQLNLSLSAVISGNETTYRGLYVGGTLSDNRITLDSTSSSGLFFKVSGTDKHQIIGNNGSLNIKNQFYQLLTVWSDTNTLFFQDVAGVGGTANASSQVEIRSTTRGFLPPRMTSAQRTAISTPATGLHVYQTDATEGQYVNMAAGWKRLLTEVDAADYIVNTGDVWSSTDKITNIVTLTQAEYNAIGSPSSNYLYVII